MGRVPYSVCAFEYGALRPDHRFHRVGIGFHLFQAPVPVWLSILPHTSGIPAIPSSLDRVSSDKAVLLLSLGLGTDWVGACT